MGRIFNVLFVIGIILIVLWVFGFVTSHTMNGYIHIALVIGIICAVVWIIGRLIGRR